MNKHLIKKLLLNKGFVIYNINFRTNFIYQTNFTSCKKRCYYKNIVDCYIGEYSHSNNRYFNLNDKIEDTLFNMDKTL